MADNKTIKYGLLGVALAIAAYFIFGRKPKNDTSKKNNVIDDLIDDVSSKLDKEDSSTSDKSKPPVSGILGFTWNASCNRYNGSTAFAIRVKQVQKEIGIIGCDIDGIVGNQTNNTLALKYPKTYRAFGGLTESNIDQYLGGKYENTSGGAGNNVVIGDVTYSWNNDCKRYNGVDEFSKKVKTVQQEIGLSGCELDGLVGNTTNNYLQKKYPKTYAKFGALTATNIEEYLGGKFEKTA